MEKKLPIRRPAAEKDNASKGQLCGFNAQAQENYNESNDENCEEIDNVSRDEQSVFPRQAEENDNARQKPQDIFAEGGSCSLFPTLDTTEEKDIDYPVSSPHLGGPPKKMKYRFRLWGNDIETESTSDQIVFPQQLPRNERSQSERIIEDEEWLQALGSRLNQIQEERQYQIQDGKKEYDISLEESEEEKERRREIHEIVEKGQKYKDVAKYALNRPNPNSEENTNCIVEDIYGIKNNDGLLTFEQKMAGRTVDSDRWKRTDVGLKTGGISRSYEAKEPRKITHRSHTDEKPQQSIASNLCDRSEQPISRVSKEKYSYLPQSHKELESFTAGGFGNSEEVEDFLVGGREKLQEIRRELGSHSRVRSLNEIYEKEVILIDSDDSVSDKIKIDEKEVSDCSVSSLGYSPSPENEKLCSLWGVENSTKAADPSKPLRGLTDDPNV